MKLDPYLIPYTEINLKWINNPNIKAATTKLLEENIEVNLHGLGFDNEFLVVPPNYDEQKKKIDKLDLVKM